MMRIPIVLIACLLSACSVKPDTSSSERVREFYSAYLPTLTSSDGRFPESKLREYVSADTLSRIEQISSIPEQDILGADYFVCAQDYDPAWIPALEVGPSRPFMGGEVLPVWIGIENGGKLELEVFVRRESGTWKIYRVRDATDNSEQAIFDTGFIAWEKAAAESGL